MFILSIFLQKTSRLKVDWTWIAFKCLLICSFCWMNIFCTYKFDIETIAFQNETNSLQQLQFFCLWSVVLHGQWHFKWILSIHKCCNNECKTCLCWDEFIIWIFCYYLHKHKPLAFSMKQILAWCILKMLLWIFLLHFTECNDGLDELWTVEKNLILTNSGEWWASLQSPLDEYIDYNIYQSRNIVFVCCNSL